MPKILDSTVKTSVVKKAMVDQDFKRELLADPRKVLGRERGKVIDKSLEIRVVENTADVRYVVIPFAGREYTGVEVEELSEKELLSIAMVDNDLRRIHA